MPAMTLFMTPGVTLGRFASLASTPMRATRAASIHIQGG